MPPSMTFRISAPTGDRFTVCDQHYEPVLRYLRCSGATAYVELPTHDEQHCSYTTLHNDLPAARRARATEFLARAEHQQACDAALSSDLDALVALLAEYHTELRP